MLLSKTSLRDFGPAIPPEDRAYELPTYRGTFSPQEAPIPVLLRHALTLIGIRHNGPAEKVSWWVTFSYKGFPCELAHQKFGLQLRIGGELDEERATELHNEARKKLLSAVKTVEGTLAETASDTLNSGNVTVVNQHRQLRRAYEYFRERASSPDIIEDVTDHGTSDSGSWSTFISGKSVMTEHAFHDLVASISAFMSALEHDLVLALPFLDFDPSRDVLTRIIGDRWGEKWRRVFGHLDPDAVRLRERLVAVVEKWRNPYSHGGFEKGHGATIYLHTPGLGALPVGLSNIRTSPLFSFLPASEADFDSIFDLFDEVDAYFVNTIPHAMEWINSGLDVRYDAEFIAEVADYVESDGALERMLDLHANRADMHANMDY